MIGMRRREFLTLIGGAAASWPRTAHAQQAGGMRRIGVLMNLAESDPETRARRAAFLQALQDLGWSEGLNVRFDYRWGVGDPDRHRKNAAELVALQPDVILAHGSPIVRALLQATRAVPIVFVSTADPIGGGFVGSLARPGGNVTGFMIFEYGLGGKWLELLKDIAPHVTRAAVILDPSQASGGGQLGAIQAVAPSFGVELRPVDVRDPDGIERDLAAFARQPKVGLIVTAAALVQIHRGRITSLAARYRLPAVYPYRFMVTSGGLMAYGPDLVDQYRRAAGYVDRILKGEKPADLPVQVPTRYDLVINLKTAKALGLTVPPPLLARADEVIE
jgi:ABC-type uncharacterized transport system substrate-binding protein